MPDHIILLTPPLLSHNLAVHLRYLNPRLRITRAGTREDLERLCQPGRLLISFCSAVVVPAALLERLGRPAYNFHPGPPSYPGARPEAFALYFEETRFGATAHVMAAKVDAGPIVGVEWIDIPPGINQLGLGDLVYVAIIRLFARLAPDLARQDSPLPHLDIEWAPRTWRFRDYDALRRLPSTLPQDEIDRRIRCASGDPDRPIELQSGETWFSLRRLQPVER
jgi:methionyl-tRNA formyltransferase